MKVYRVEIQKQFRKGNQTIQEVFCKSNLEPEDVRRAYTSKYQPFSIQLEEVKGFDELVVELPDALQRVQNTYSDPTTTLEIDSCSPEIQKKTEKILELRKEAEAMEKSLADDLKTLVRSPHGIRVNLKSISVSGYYRQDVMKRLSPLADDSQGTSKS